MSNERAERLRKLRATLALATDNPNKAEAMAAFAKARAYADKYGLTLDEAEQTNTFEEFGQREAFSGTKQYGYVDRFLWLAIAEFCRCKVGVGMDEDGDLTIKYFGHEVDVELAFWLRNTVKAAMAFEWEIYRDFVMPKGSKLNEAMFSFHSGMANELKARMQRVVSETPAGDGRSLIIVQRVEEAAKAVGFVAARSGKARAHAHDSSAYGAGSDAGRRVDIGRGVSHNPTRMIGRG